MNQPSSDGDYVLVEYTHPNRGQHRVIGPATKTFYGFRGGGERFLVHKDDVAAHPQYYRPIQTTQVNVPLPSHMQDVPPPPPVMKVEEPVVAKAPADIRAMLDAIDDQPTAFPHEDHPVPGEMQVEALAVSTFDLQTLPGITPAIELGLKRSNLDSPKAIMEAGVSGLESVKYVGKTKAKLIYEFVVDKYGLDDAD